MGELQVRAMGQRIVLDEVEGARLGFGRVNLEPGAVKGWGYDGRFVELSADPLIHRLWGEIAWEGGLWRVRSLGTRDPVVVEPRAHRAIELAPSTIDEAPQEFAVTQASFDVLLNVAASSFRLECRRTADADVVAARRASSGSDTVTLREELADCVTPTEFSVLWVMAREYRDASGGVAEPLSYARIRRELQLSDKQAVGAVERVVRRVRTAGLVPVDLGSDQQRDWLCRQLVAHGVFDELADRHGPPPTG